jgi:hypothetical protein
MRFKKVLTEAQVRNRLDEVLIDAVAGKIIEFSPKYPKPADLISAVIKYYTSDPTVSGKGLFDQQNQVTDANVAATKLSASVQSFSKNSISLNPQTAQQIVGALINGSQGQQNQQARTI